MKQVHRVIAMVAQGSISVLIGGETRVGKEVVGSTLHHRSPREGGPLYPSTAPRCQRRCSRASSSGTSAARSPVRRGKEGLLQTGSGGTVFLDEIAEMPLGAQAKLLRALEQGEVLRVGATKPQSIDVRLIAATNHRPEEAIAQD